MVPVRPVSTAIFVLCALNYLNAAVLHIDKTVIPYSEFLQPSSTYVIEYGPLYSPNSSEPEASLVYVTPALSPDKTLVADIPRLPVKLALTKYVVSIAPTPKLHPRRNFFLMSSPNPPATVYVDRLSTSAARLRWSATGAANPLDGAGSTYANNQEQRLSYTVSYRMLLASYSLKSSGEAEAVKQLEGVYGSQVTIKNLIPGASYLANVSTVWLDDDQRRIVSEETAVVWLMQPEAPSALREVALRTNESSLTVSWKEPALFSLVDYYLARLTGGTLGTAERTLKVPVTSSATEAFPRLPADGGGATFKTVSSGNVQPLPSATFNNVEPGTSYNISVQSVVDRRVMPGPSVQFSAPVTVQVTTVPEPPASLTHVSSVNSGQENRSALVLQWMPPRTGNADGYIVNVRPALNNTQSVTVDQLGRTARFESTPGAVYRVDVQSHSGPQMKQRFSKPLSQTVVSGPPAPESVWFIPGATTSTSATIAWTIGTAAKDVAATAGSENVMTHVVDFYEVHVNSSADGAATTSVVRRGSDGGAQTAIVKGLLPAHTYQVDVVAVTRLRADRDTMNAMDSDNSKTDAVGVVEKSLPTSVIVRTKPAKPQGLTVETLNTTSVRLSWRAETDDVDGSPRRDILYQISVARASSPQNIISSYKYQPRALAAGGRASVNLSPLESATQYIFEVRTVYADDLVSEPVATEGGPASLLDIQLLVSNVPDTDRNSPAVSVQQPYVTVIVKKLPVVTDKISGVDMMPQLLVEYVSMDNDDRGLVNVTNVPISSLLPKIVEKDSQSVLGRSGGIDDGVNGSANVLSAVVGPLTPGALYKFHVRNLLTGKELYTTEEVMQPSPPLELKVDSDDTVNGTSEVVLSWLPPPARRMAASDSKDGVFDRYYLSFASTTTMPAGETGIYVPKSADGTENKEISTTDSNRPATEAAATIIRKRVKNLVPGETYKVRLYTESHGRRSSTYAELQLRTPPEGPEYLKLIAVESEKIIVEWKAAPVTNVSHFVLEVVNLNFSVSVAPPSAQQQSHNTLAAGNENRFSIDRTQLLSTESGRPLTYNNNNDMLSTSSALAPLLATDTSASVVTAATAGNRNNDAISANQNSQLRARRSAAFSHYPSKDDDGLGMAAQADYAGNESSSSRLPLGFNERMGQSNEGARSFASSSAATAGFFPKAAHGPNSKRQQRWTIPAMSSSASGNNGVYQRTLSIMPTSALCCKGAVYSLSVRSVVGGSDATARESRQAMLIVQSLPPSIAIPQSNVKVLNTTAVEVHFKLTYPPQLSLFDAVEFRLNSSSNTTPHDIVQRHNFKFATQLMPETQRSLFAPLENPVTLTNLVPGETYSLDGWTVAGDNGQSKSALSTPVNGITLKPASVSNLTVDESNATTIVVSWEPPVVYSIYHYFELLCNGTPSVVTLPKTHRTYIINGLRPWTKYSITVVAVSSGGSISSSSSSSNNNINAGGSLANDLIGGAEEKLMGNGEKMQLPQDERIVAGVMSAAAGIGGQRSEPTTILVETAEAVPGPLRSVNSWLLSPRQLQIEWAAPDVPNGEIQNYTIEYRGLQRDTSKRMKVLNVSTYGTVLDDLEPGEPYELQLYAATRAGTGDSFIVNVPPMPIWSPPLSPVDNKPRVRSQTAQTIEVEFSDTMFDKSYGDIVAYTIIVAEHNGGLDDMMNTGNDHTGGQLDKSALPPRSADNAFTTSSSFSWFDVQSQSVWSPYQVTVPFNPFADDRLTSRSANATDESSRNITHSRKTRAVPVSSVDNNNDAIKNQTTVDGKKVVSRRTQLSSPRVATFTVGSDTSCTLPDTRLGSSSKPFADSTRAKRNTIYNAPGSYANTFARRFSTTPTGGGYGGFHHNDRQLHALDAVAVIPDDESAMLLSSSPTRLRTARLNNNNNNDNSFLMHPLFDESGAWPARNNNNAAATVLKARLSDSISGVNATTPPLHTASSFCNGPLKPNTEYAVRVRAYTSLTPSLKFTDSQPIIVSTLSIGSLSTNFLLSIILPICAALVLVALVCALLIIRRRRYGPFVKRTRRANARAVEDKLSITESLQERTRPIKVDQFANHVRIMSADSDFRFSEEYDELKSVGKEQQSAAADLPCNRPKNRFTNILPYDHSRVKLQPTDDEEGTDYVNASYMPGYNSPREFIVAQGPLHSTRDDFWRMIWEQNSHVVVSLTRCIEKGREKCDHYWPYDTEPVMYGDIQVTIMNEVQTPDWTIREFRVCQDDQTRSIRHFHFTAWPDFGVPQYPQVLVQFIRAFRERVSSEIHPIVCHCSAGVGRSGTFIVLDRILQQLEKTAAAKRVGTAPTGDIGNNNKIAAKLDADSIILRDNNKSNTLPSATYGGGVVPYVVDDDCSIDIFGIVYEMRRERCSMVQTEQQYIYIHHCVLCVLEGREDCIDEHDENDNKFFSASNTLTADSRPAANAMMRYSGTPNVTPGYHQSLPRGYNANSFMLGEHHNNNHHQAPPRYETMQRHNSQLDSSRMRYFTQHRGGNSDTLPYNNARLASQSSPYAGSVGNIASLHHHQQQQSQRMAAIAPANFSGGGAVGPVAAENLGYDDDEGIAESGPF